MLLRNLRKIYATVEIHLYERANLRIANEKQKANSHEGITWSELENKICKQKRSIQFLALQERRLTGAVGQIHHVSCILIFLI